MKEAIVTLVLSVFWAVTMFSAFQMGRHWTMARVYGVIKDSLDKVKGFTHEEANGVFKFCDEINGHIKRQKL